MRKIRAEELELMRNANVIFTLIDARPHDDFKKEHIPGALSIPFDHLGKHLDLMKQRRRTDTFITYCSDLECEASEVAAKKLEKYGFKNVLELRGGLEDWKKAGYPTEK